MAEEKDTTDLAKFNIACSFCKKDGKNDQTLIYVSWEKRYYMVTCYTCGTTEAFDEFAKAININKKEADEELQKN